mmetsp:Transcript_21390/g.70748  ORF Transcript_21390/g.70748 Transcript_21390/m.70748 type:complete len:254 (-) Transcript_21390:162-923(-)
MAMASMFASMAKRADLEETLRTPRRAPSVAEDPVRLMPLARPARFDSLLLALDLLMESRSATASSSVRASSTSTSRLVLRGTSRMSSPSGKTTSREPRGDDDFCAAAAAAAAALSRLRWALQASSMSAMPSRSSADCDFFCSLRLTMRGASPVSSDSARSALSFRSSRASFCRALASASASRCCRRLSAPTLQAAARTCSVARASSSALRALALDRSCWRFATLPALTRRTSLSTIFLLQNQGALSHKGSTHG